VIRVPERLAPAVLRYAHELDEKESDSQLHEPGAPYRTAEDVEMTQPVNVASVPQRSPFRYPGGKTWLVPYIRSWLASKTPEAGVLVEPFAGGGIVGLTAGFEDLVEHVVRERLTFIEGDGIEIIRRYSDDERAAFFVDPPYTVAAKRLYPHWQVDHRILFGLLAEVKGDVLLTYDNTREIASLASEFGFETQAATPRKSREAKMNKLLIGRNFSKWLKQRD